MRIESERTAAVVHQLERTPVGKKRSVRDLMDAAAERGLTLDAGTVNGLMGRLESEGWLAIDWRDRDRGTRKKGPKREQVYGLTPDGRRGIVAALTAYATAGQVNRSTYLPGTAPANGGSD